jgi:hypothetical protein
MKTEAENQELVAPGYQLLLSTGKPAGNNLKREKRTGEQHST